MNWYALIERLNFKALIPTCYERFIPLVMDGLAWFLSNLSKERQQLIYDDQMSLGLFSTTEDRLERIMSSCPTLHKFGQVLARDSRLDLELRNSLKRLESMPAKYSKDETIKILEISGMDISKFQFDYPPIAEASVAIVIPFKRKNENGTITEGVFKVIKPEACHSLTEELDLWPLLGESLKRICKEKNLPVLEFTEPLNETAQMIKQEVNLGVERKNLALMEDYFRDQKIVRVPKILPWCTDRTTSMELIEGTSVGNFVNAPIDIRKEIAERIFYSLIALPFWMNRDEVVFHGDPHAGNLFIDQNGIIVPLDWSLTATLSRKERSVLIQIMLCGLKKDEHGMTRALKKLGKARGTKNELEKIVRVSICALKEQGFPTFDWLLDLFDRALEKGRLSLNGNLALFRKSLFSSLSVIKEIYPEVSTDKILLKTGIEKLIGETPFRAFANPFDQNWGTQLSNAQIMELCNSWPTVYKNLLVNYMKNK